MFSFFLCRFVFIAVWLMSSLSLSHADIFGTDDRQEALNSPAQSFTESVAVGVLSSLWDENADGSGRLIPEAFGSSLLCKDEKFHHQKSLAYACTGFLVGPDLLVTAGHCANHTNTEIKNESEMYCDSYTWMFDYYNSTNTQTVPKDSVYHCDEILYATFKGEANAPDFALIKLDRPVKNRRFLELSQNESLYRQKVSMLGHPMGFPMKYADNAMITTPPIEKNNSYFTNLDALSGNSGSPVFNKNYEVIGLLVGGLPNHTTYYDKKNKCERYNTCDTNGKNCIKEDESLIQEHLPRTFSEVQRISLYKDLINSYKYRYF